MARQRRRGRWKAQVTQIRDTYRLARQGDDKLPWMIAGAAALVFLVFLGVGFVVSSPILFGVLGILGAIPAATIVFGRRAQRSAYRQIEGKPGAATAVLGSLRRGWTVTEGVAVTPARDPAQAALVHRAVGRPGVVLVAEGPRNKAAALLAQEKRRMARVVSDVPVYEFLVGDGENQVPLAKLQRRLIKLPRNLRAPQVTEVERRLRAMPSAALPIPKGPLPRNARMPRGQMRGR